MTREYLSGSVRQRNGYWIARYRLPNGKDTSKKLGRVWKLRGEQPALGYDTKRTAEAKLNEILSVYEGWTPGSDPLFSFAASEYLEWQENEHRLRKTTMHEYRRLIGANLLPTLGKKTLTAITQQDVTSLRADLARRGLSASSLNQTRIVFSGIIKYARKKRGYPGVDPSQWFDRAVQRQKVDIEVYSPAEIELLARTLREGTYRGAPQRVLSEFEVGERRRMDDQDAVIVKTSGYAGLRLGEIRALKWRDIDFAGSKITVRSGYTDHGGLDAPKSGKARSIPMSTNLAAELDRLSRRRDFTAPQNLVFCNVFGDVLSGSGIYQRFLSGCQAAGLRKLKFHSLRHAYCTLMVRAFPLSDVMAYAGHANIQTTMRYVHFRPQTDAAKKMDVLLESNLVQPDFDEIHPVSHNESEI